MSSPKENEEKIDEEMLDRFRMTGGGSPNHNHKEVDECKDVFDVCLSRGCRKRKLERMFSANIGQDLESYASQIVNALPLGFVQGEHPPHVDLTMTGRRIARLNNMPDGSKFCSTHIAQDRFARADLLAPILAAMKKDIMQMLDRDNYHHVCFYCHDLYSDNDHNSKCSVRYGTFCTCCSEI